MNKDEIKKTLKTCNPTYYNCKICPYKSVERCVDTLNNDAVNLITEQEKEIDRLKAENKQLKTECALLDDELRIARQDTIDVLNKLKTKSYVNNYCREVVEAEKIDEMIKELVKCRR